MKIAILYYSGYGHTVKLAETIVSVIEQHNVDVAAIQISADGDISEQDWQQLDQADGIIMGAPTYMGMVPWQFKKVADASSKAWAQQLWQGKLAAGFTNSASIAGDKDSTMSYLQTLAMQHGMLWVGLGVPPANTMTAQRNDLNYFGATAGLLAQSPSDSSPEDGPLPGDLKTAELFAQRFVESVERWTR